MKKLLLIKYLLVVSFANAQWQQITADTQNVRAIFVNDATIYGISNFGVCRSTDSGNSWSLQNSGLPTNVALNSITGNSSIVLLGGYGVVFISSNSGNSWYPAPCTGLPYNNVSNLFIYGTNIYAVVEGAGLFISNNNGYNWIPVNNGLTTTMIFSFVANGTDIFIGTDNGIYKSSNSGFTWISANVGLNNVHVYSLLVKGTDIFAGTDNGIFVSTDNGQLWTAINNGLTNPITNITNTITTIVNSGSTLLAGGFPADFLGMAYMSNDNGNLWTPIDTNIFNVRVFKVNSTDVYAVVPQNNEIGPIQYNIWRQPLLGLTSVNENKMENSFTIYPNPNGGNMTLEYQLNENGVLIIYDITGKQLQSYNFSSESSQLNINASTLNAGMYLNDVFINTIKVKTDRIVIVK